MAVIGYGHRPTGNMGAYIPAYSYPDLSLRTVTNVSGHNAGGLYIMAGDVYWAGIIPNSADGVELGIWDGRLSDEDFYAAFLRRVPTTLDPVIDDIHLQFELLGNSLSLSAWRDGDPKPSTPQILLNNGRMGNGNVGLFHNHRGTFTTAEFGMFEA